MESLENGAGTPICRKGTAIQALRMDLWTQRGESGIRITSLVLYISYHVKLIAKRGCCTIQGTQSGAL